MKTTTIIYILLVIGLIALVATNTSLLDKATEGFQAMSSEPIIAKGIEPRTLPIQARPNDANPGSLPFAPYGQTASVGSFPYQDPARLPADLNQIKKLYEDLRSFLVFEGANISSNGDPTIQLPLTQLRADSRTLQEEKNVLEKNPGIQSSLTQQSLADIQGALSFLQKKVRLFETAGVVSGGVEGFTGTGTGTGSGSGSNPRATLDNIIDLRDRIYASLLILTASGSTDTVVQSRIKTLQTMYSSVTDIITGVNNGTIAVSAIPLFQNDINAILPNLANPNANIDGLYSNTSNDYDLSPIEKQIGKLVGDENAARVFRGILDNGSFNLSLDLGYNKKQTSSTDNQVKYSKTIASNKDTDGDLMETDSAFDSVSPGMDDRISLKNFSNNSQDQKRLPGLDIGLDWEKRGTDICRQVSLRNLNPLDFGCIPEGSQISAAFSWRGYTRMVCGRLSSTMDPDLPRVCGCPPSNWKGWTLSY
jgi:hypothetical protein